MKYIFHFLLIIIFIPACSSPGENYANKVCSCLKESGLKNGYNQKDFIRNFEPQNPSMDEIGEEIYETMKEMSNSQRASFMKDFSRALLDTDCAEIAFNMIPYDQMIEQMRRKYDKSNTSSFDFFSKDPSICDCVEAEVNANNVMRKKCKEMEEVWRERYENGDEDDQKEMIKEIEDCERLKDAQK